LALVYAWYQYREYTHGGSWPGIVSGILGLVAIVFLMCFGIIKRRYRSSLGNLQTWLHLHVYLGLLVLFLILFHSGFRFQDWVAGSAFILLAIVVGSGFVGAVLYTEIPPKLIYVEANMSVDELSDEMNQVIKNMRRLAAKSSTAFQRLCNYLIEAECPHANAKWRVMFTYHARRRRPNEGAVINNLKSAIDPAEAEELAILLNQRADLSKLHEQLIDKQRYVNVMAAWLYIHVPLSLLLLIAMGTHVVAALHFRFW